MNRVALRPRGTLSLTKPEELIVHGALVRDTFGRPIDRNDDRQAGGDSIATITGNRVRTGGVPVARTQHDPAADFAAIDLLMARGELAPQTS
jgi:hypothetical protein